MTATRSIFEIFADVKREVGPVGKDSRNQQQNFNYRGIDAVVNAAAGALDKYGVITAPILDQYDYDGNVEVGKNRSLMGHAKVQVTYRFYGPAGDHFDARVPGEAMDSGDKATAKAMSVAYRIALLQCLNLPTDEADPDSQTYERSPRASAGDAWESAAPSSPRQPQNSSRDSAQRSSAPSWLDTAIAKAATFKTEADGTDLWKESAAKVHGREVTPADAKNVQDLIAARIEDLRTDAMNKALALLSEGDEWRLKVQELADVDSAREAIAEVSREVTNKIRAGRITQAIAARWPKAAEQEAAAA